MLSVSLGEYYMRRNLKTTYEKYNRRNTGILNSDVKILKVTPMRNRVSH